MSFDIRSSGTGHHRRQGSGSRAGDALLLLALGALVVNSWRWLSCIHQRRLINRSQPLPRPLQTWEGEGGRPDPEPETTAASYIPPGGTVSTPMA